MTLILVIGLAAVSAIAIKYAKAYHMLTDNSTYTIRREYTLYSDADNAFNRLMAIFDQHKQFKLISVKKDYRIFKVVYKSFNDEYIGLNDDITKYTIVDKKQKALNQ